MNNKGFNLITVVIIVIITSVVSAFTTGIILNNNYKGESGLSYTEIMNDEQLSEFIHIYSTILAEYYDDVDSDGMISSAIEAMQNYEGKDSEELLSVATEAMLNFLGDDYTTFLNSSDSELLMDTLDTSYDGIGVTIQNNIVLSVLKGSPAEKAGILANDTIIKVGETIINENNYNQIATLIKENGSEYVNITILRDTNEIEYEIKKEKLDSSVTSRIIEDTNTGYIAVDVFSENVGDSFGKNLLSLEETGINNLIIDLRYNTGGYLDGATDIASLFLKPGENIYSLENKDSRIYVDDETKEYREYEIIILMNGESASASEILAAALVDSYGASIVGTQSYGKGKVQQTVSNSEGIVAKYTSSKWYTPNGLCIDEVGLTPNYNIELEYIKDDYDNIIDIVDTQFEKALELLK